MSKVIKFSDFLSCEPIYIELFGKQYLVKQDIEIFVNHLANTRDAAAKKIKEELAKEKIKTGIDEVDNTMNQIDSVIEAMNSKIDNEELVIESYLGKENWEEIKFKYKEVVGEGVSLKFVSELSKLVSSLGQTGEVPQEEDDGSK